MEQLPPKQAVFPAPLMIAAMAIGAVLIYRTVSLPWILVGLLIFGLLAVWRPGLALLFIPVTVPWYLQPVYIPDIRAEGTVFSLHEVLLLVICAATMLHVSGNWVSRPGAASARKLPPIRSLLALAGPGILFLIAGIAALLIAVERAPALRDFRWFIVEPLLFYALLRWQMRRDSTYTRQITLALVVSGVFVAILALLQVVGIDLVPILLSPTKSFGESSVDAGAVTRVTSVYGHPNNLGMFLGRIWPLAAVCAVHTRRGSANTNYAAGAFAAAALLILAGIGVSFSRGAWLGAGAAFAVLAYGLFATRLANVHSTAQRFDAVPERKSGLLLFLVVIALVFVAAFGLIFVLRGDLLGGSTGPRVLIWQESLRLIAQHPFGLGLDQFYYYHNPEFGRSLIDPSLVGKSDQFARHPHNLVLELWLMLTPLGLAAFVWLIARFVRRGLAQFRVAPSSEQGLLAIGALAAMAAALTHGLVDTFYFWPDIAFVFWLLLALVERNYSGGVFLAGRRPAKNTSFSLVLKQLRCFKTSEKE